MWSETTPDMKKINIIVFVSPHVQNNHNTVLMKNFDHYFDHFNINLLQCSFYLLFLMVLAELSITTNTHDLWTHWFGKKSWTILRNLTTKSCNESCSKIVFVTSHFIKIMKNLFCKWLSSFLISTSCVGNVHVSTIMF